MGLFDDITSFVGVVNSIRSEITQLGTDMVKEITTNTTAVKQTVTDTTEQVASSVSEIKSETTEALADDSSCQP